MLLTLCQLFLIASEININLFNLLNNDHFIVIEYTNLPSLYLRLQILKCHLDLQNIGTIDFPKDAFIMTKLITLRKHTIYCLIQLLLLKIQ